MIRVRSACKINLTLDVLRRRDDGYHELDSLVHTVALWDEIVVTPGGSGFRCKVDLPADNLCTRAARLWLEASRANFSSVGIELQKNLPIGAGIGGGSANAAAVLLALNEWQREKGEEPLAETELARIAKALGADVPLFLRGGAQRMQGIGEQLTSLQPADFWVVLLKPPVFGDTRAIFALWGETRPPSQHATESLLESWGSRGLEAIAASLGNDLADAARRSGQPIDETLGLLRGAGAVGVCLSGSGAACFGLFENETRAREAELKLRAETPSGWFCAAAALCAHGVEFF